MYLKYPCPAQLLHLVPSEPAWTAAAETAAAAGCSQHWAWTVAWWAEVAGAGLNGQQPLVDGRSETAVAEAAAAVAVAAAAVVVVEAVAAVGLASASVFGPVPVWCQKVLEHKPSKFKCSSSGTDVHHGRPVFYSYLHSGVLWNLSVFFVVVAKFCLVLAWNMSGIYTHWEVYNYVKSAKLERFLLSLNED